MIYQEIAKKETIDSIHEWMVFVLTKITSYISKEKNKNNTSNIDIVLNFINKHYKDDISVDQIAELVNLNPSYLSRIFKQNVGITIVEYLTRRRLTESKILLTNSNYTIREIAAQIGYNNVNSYIRFFKKYEGITPGEYRKIDNTNMEC
ncbi:hypothetical protein J8TS2_40830 [Lederbergia ruris]|uniref:HTH araC/xylS-type domain-containing protein n=1 Tax=Lederbergia ruris TaxID=217495 RepID=A0ABQ4KPA4_9BACI|nr:AraC family transcriptional regulator [Lederbergia ruris]GIN59764.1 hypothetical protein J8TS2_40830 [Lederbergia ruris]